MGSLLILHYRKKDLGNPILDVLNSYQQTECHVILEKVLLFGAGFWLQCVLDDDKCLGICLPDMKIQSIRKPV